MNVNAHPQNKWITVEIGIREIGNHSSSAVLVGAGALVGKLPELDEHGEKPRQEFR